MAEAAEIKLFLMQCRLSIQKLKDMKHAKGLKAAKGPAVGAWPNQSGDLTAAECVTTSSDICQGVCTKMLMQPGGGARLQNSPSVYKQMAG